MRFVKSLLGRFLPVRSFAGRIAAGPVAQPNRMRCKEPERHRSKSKSTSVRCGGLRAIILLIHRVSKFAQWLVERSLGGVVPIASHAGRSFCTSTPDDQFLGVIPCIAPCGFVRFGAIPCVICED
jgi:hypothetical protein